jgi:hypothetical protein
LDWADIRKIAEQAAFTGRDDLLEVALELYPYNRNLFLALYTQGNVWVKQGIYSINDVLTQYFKELPQDEQYAILAELRRRGLPQPATTEEQGSVPCTIGLDEIKPGEAYTKCTFETPHHFSLQADEAWFRTNPRKCPFCYHLVPKTVYVNAPPPPPLAPPKTYKAPSGRR